MGKVWLTLVLVCGLGYSLAEASSKEESVVAVGRDTPSPLQSERILPEVFMPSEWYRDEGSGGFPENFADEYPRVDEGERRSEEQSSRFWLPHPENCLHWPC